MGGETKLISKAVIAGLDGTVWAKSANIEPSKEELSKISGAFPDQSKLAEGGVMMGGEKFIYLSGNDKVIRCKKGKSGLHAVKTIQAVLVAVYEEPVQANQVAKVVEDLGDYLVSVSY